jgi:3D-(3,5/4)-trihydroxycyclohexane-1,2-dione acylhydrolase (decyclizing)
VLYSRPRRRWRAFAESAGVPVVETQAGKSARCPGEPSAQCSVRIGVTGTERRQRAGRRAADLVIGVGTRLQDFTTGSRALFGNPAQRLVQINVAALRRGKHGALPLVGDARTGSPDR